MHHRQVLHFLFLCPFSISSALSVHFAASSVSAVPSCLSLWLIITDWLLLSPEGGHTVQLISQAPGPQALPHISSPPSPAAWDQRSSTSLEKVSLLLCLNPPTLLPLMPRDGLFQDGRWTTRVIPKSVRHTGTWSLIVKKIMITGIVSTVFDNVMRYLLYRLFNRIYIPALFTTITTFYSEYGPLMKQI